MLKKYVYGVLVTGVVYACSLTSTIDGVMTFYVVHPRPLAFARRLDSVAKSAQWQGKGLILT